MTGFIYTADTTPFSDAEKEDIKVINKNIKKYIATLMRSFTSKVEEAVINNQKYFYLDTFEEDDMFENISKYDIVNDKYKHKIIKYNGPKNFKCTRFLLESLIKQPKYNNGKDPITNQDYKISIFTRKGEKSKFKNGIVISRDGISYK